MRGFGETPAQAFEQAALALTALVADPATVRPLDPVALRCEAPDEERLLAAWLDALAREMAERRMLFSRFRVRLEGARLSAQAWGEALDPARHRPEAGVKRATGTTLRVARHGEGWIAQTVIEQAAP